MSTLRVSSEADQKTSLLPSVDRPEDGLQGVLRSQAVRSLREPGRPGDTFHWQGTLRCVVLSILTSSIVLCVFEFSRAGLDDARNTAKLCYRLVKDGCRLNITRSLWKKVNPATLFASLS